MAGGIREPLETWEDAAKRLHTENKTLHVALGSHEGPECEPETPYEERELMTMKIMRLWVVQLEPSMCGPRGLAEKALQDSGIHPVDWESNGLILIPPGRPGHHNESHIAPWSFDIIKKSLEAGGTIRAEYFWPYGVKG